MTGSPRAVRTADRGFRSAEDRDGQRAVSGLCVAAPGPDQVSTKSGALGTKRSKAGSRLAYSTADAEHWAARFSDDGLVTQVLLNPGRDQLWLAIESMCLGIAGAWRSEAAWGAEVAFFFSGHGSRHGELVLHDSAVRVTEIVRRISEARPRSEPNLIKLGLALDCCYAGSGLLSVVADLPESVSLRDGLASSLHDEEAYEYDELGHGIFTYVLKNATGMDEHAKTVVEILTRSGWCVEQGVLVAPANLPVESPLMKAGHELLGGFRETVVDLRALPYLSDGDQHALDVMNSHVVSVAGRGAIDLAEERIATVQELSEMIEDLCRMPLDLGIRFPGWRSDW